MANAGSSKGRTDDFESSNLGSTPSPASERNYHAEWYERNKVERRKQIHQRRDAMRIAGRQLIRDYLSDHPCIDCGEDDSDCLDFDHVWDVKKMCVTHMVSAGYTAMAILDEIAKCEVRCANCHRKRHARMRKD